MTKVNKWTLGLAAVGLVSLPAFVQAEEKPNQLLTALASTTISGYVDTSAQWTLGSGNANPPGYAYNTSKKQDSFNLNVVDITLEKPLDEGTWSAGYKVELWFGPNASTLGNNISSGDGGNDLAIKQGYVALRAPIGNGLDFKIGTWDTIIGYEVANSGSNPNYTRSYGYTLEPTTHTGVLGTYQICKAASVSAGIANTMGPKINQKSNPPRAESYKTYMASFALTAPDDWGFLAGSTAYAGFINGFNAGTTWDQTSYYAGFTMNTPIKGWRVGASYDYVDTTSENALNGHGVYANALALYSSITLTEKLSVHARGEYAWAGDAGTGSGLFGTQPTGGVTSGNHEIFALTGTLQYDLWKNVLSRLEIRWDHQAGDGQMAGWGGESTYGGSASTKRNSVLVAANLIYNF